MPRAQSVKWSLERALAFAHAAADDPTEERISLARTSAQHALAYVGALDFTLGDARHLTHLAAQLRAVLAVVERRESALVTPARAN